ncbi:MAG TPA: potassium-transporting ATPase subunit KdpA [Bacteroidales bacterium]|nr:potassium-transporting ATPase subunit KdpA [Bacteroidales bacterium]
MNAFDGLQIIVFFGILILLTPILGNYMAKVFSEDFSNQRTKKKFWNPIRYFSWFEKLVYKICGIKPDEPMNWKTYAVSLLVFNFFGFLLLFILQLVQKWMPANPQDLNNIGLALSFNTAASFVTNTNWQSYAGETTMSYAVQMLGLTVQNFLSAATGITVIMALIRGLKNKTNGDIGNFRVDLTRSVVYVLMPLSIVLALLLVSQGVVQTFDSYVTVQTLEGAEQTIAVGPAASQIAIKMLGTNGGGFFNANSAHPFENPTPFTNFLEMFALILIPMALTYTFGKMIGSVKQGWTIFIAMFVLCIVGLAIMLYSEYSYNPVLQHAGIMEGKETRFGVMNSVLFANITTNVSCGAVNCMHSSLSPMAGMIATINMMLGEIVFGGVGAGLYGMLIFVILTVFIAGLMVGRTPEFLGKKIEAKEVKMAIVAVLAPNFVILVFTAIAVSLPVGLSSMLNTGAHGFSEILYAFTSAAANNGSAFAGLNANTNFYNIMLGIGMLIGRFAIIVPVLAIAGSLSVKKIVPQSSGTFKTDTGLFIFLLIAIILIVGALTHFPALSLGSIIEHFLMLSGKTF